jgi:hypothetical protein
MTLHLSACTLALLGALCAGCATPFGTPVFESRPAGQTDFPGIAQLAASAPGQGMDVLLVHGMCTHDARWAQASIASLSRMLGGPDAPAALPEAVPGTQTTLYRAALPTAHGLVNASALVWSPVIAPLKAQLCHDQTDPSDTCRALAPDTPPFPFERAHLNRALKDRLLDDCLADALIYQGRSREAISAQIQLALLAASTPGGAALARPGLLRAASTASRPIVFIAESLGSKVAFDAIYRLQTSADSAERSAGTRLFDRFAQVFMAANQLPLLALADQDLGGASKARSAPDYPVDPLAALLSHRQARSLAADARPLRVIAFTDPNDLLSYTLSRSTGTQPFDVVDVIVSNERTLFGIFERPDTAHTGYLANAAVTRLMACGTAGCKP